VKGFVSRSWIGPFNGTEALPRLFLKRKVAESRFSESNTQKVVKKGNLKAKLLFRKGVVKKLEVRRKMKKD